MRMHRAILIGLALLVSGSTASAAVLWNWSFAGESGTFITDGTFADASGAHTFHFLHFGVTASTVPANVGGTYFEEQPSDGMVWSGSAPTEFFRLSGALTNGSNFRNAANSYRYTLFPGVSFLVDQKEITVTSGDLKVAADSDVDVEIPSVPAAGPEALALLAALVAGAGAVLSRRA